MSDCDHGGLDGLADAAEAADLERHWDRKEWEAHVLLMPNLYRRAKRTKVGHNIECPVCGKVFRKKSYQQAFCSNKGTGNCKDRYWNTVDEKRSDRAAIYSKHESSFNDDEYIEGLDYPYWD